MADALNFTGVTDLNANLTALGRQFSLPPFSMHRNAVQISTNSDQWEEGQSNVARGAGGDIVNWRMVDDRAIEEAVVRADEAVFR